MPTEACTYHSILCSRSRPWALDPVPSRTKMQTSRDTLAAPAFHGPIAVGCKQELSELNSMYVKNRCPPQALPPALLYAGSSCPLNCYICHWGTGLATAAPQAWRYSIGACMASYMRRAFASLLSLHIHGTAQSAWPHPAHNMHASNRSFGIPCACWHPPQIDPMKLPT